MPQDPSYELMHSIVEAVDYANPYAPNGGTIALNGLPLPTTGFYVGGAAPELTYDRPVDLDGPEVREFVESAPSSYVGWWVDEETSKIHIDAVNWYQGEYTAASIGRVRGEIAIWDIRNERELRLS